MTAFNNQHPTVVVGGGLSGLISAALVGRRGTPVVLLEKASSLGGRAATRQKDGFHVNLGPHALYRRGLLRETLTSLGVDIRGGVPTGGGGFVIRDGHAHTLPIGFASMLTTGALSVHGKLEFARLSARLASVNANEIQRDTLASWLDRHVHDRGARQLVEMLVRVTTFTNDPLHQSAGAAIEQVQLALKGSVLYLHEGWQTIVDGLRRVAAEAGVRIVSGAAATALERDATRVDAVRLADGSTIRASGVILATLPGDVDSLTGVTRFTHTAGPAVRVASLDVALRSLPRPKRTVAFGGDVPLYFSVHSAVARLAPEGGAMVHVSKYLRPDESADAGVERELEGLMDMMQPGWRDSVAFRTFLPNLVVTHAEATAARGGIAGRPPSRLEAFDNVFIAGDWVGSRGQLSDGCAASAATAADLVVRAAVSANAAA